ncbi:MAG: S8 family serine peptidase [Aureispira sp.]|nr:S8 family serine peptidase [Aureispira sp.]
MKYILTILAFSFISIAQAQYNFSMFWVELTDKDNTPYSVFHPEDFLSYRALERREKQGIAIEENDLPISPDYEAQIESKGVRIHHRSKWFNSLAIHVTDTSVLTSIKNLPFVKSIRPIGQYRKAKAGKMHKKRFQQDNYKKVKQPYGYGQSQISMLNGVAVHKFGYQGDGMHVAVLDGGFLNVYRMPFFDSLRAHNGVLGTHDFVDGDDFVYESSSHGSGVLSTMASNLPYLLVGTAPKASYYLFKTEDTKGEFRMEEFNWVAAAERADSLGVDVINSSLGYTSFSDTSMNYTYEDINGETALITRGADIAAEKGILVVNSCGNEGDGKWHYIGTPADAKNVLSVGAVRSDGKRSFFSSWGPTADGRIKPDVAAQGTKSATGSIMGYDVAYSNGTSFSGPIMAGMITSLWQAFPDKTNFEIMDMVKLCGHQATKPDSSLGYGIPNFFYAYLLLSEAGIVVDREGSMFSTLSTVKDRLGVFIENGEEEAKVEIKLHNKLQQVLYQKQEFLPVNDIKEFRIPNMEDYPSGLYMLSIKINYQSYWIKVIKE